MRRPAWQRLVCASLCVALLASSQVARAVEEPKDATTGQAIDGGEEAARDHDDADDEEDEAPFEYELELSSSGGHATNAPIATERFRVSGGPDSHVAFGLDPKLTWNARQVVSLELRYGFSEALHSTVTSNNLQEHVLSPALALDWGAFMLEIGADWTSEFLVKDGFSHFEDVLGGSVALTWKPYPRWSFVAEIKADRTFAATTYAYLGGSSATLDLWARWKGAAPRKHFLKLMLTGLANRSGTKSDAEITETALDNVGLQIAYPYSYNQVKLRLEAGWEFIARWLVKARVDGSVFDYTDDAIVLAVSEKPGAKQKGKLDKGQALEQVDRRLVAQLGLLWSATGALDVELIGGVDGRQTKLSSSKSGTEIQASQKFTPFTNWFSTLGVTYSF